MAGNGVNPRTAHGVATDHHIFALGQHRLALVEVDGDGTHLVTARRDTETGVWRISAAGQPLVKDPERDYPKTAAAEVTATNIHDCIQKMCDHVLLHLHGSTEVPGYSTWVPHSVRRLDGEESFQAFQAGVGLHGVG